MPIDLDKAGNLIGLEILEASERLGNEALRVLIVEGLTTIVRSGEDESLSTEKISSAMAATLHEAASTSAGKVDQTG